MVDTLGCFLTKNFTENYGMSGERKKQVKKKGKSGQVRKKKDSAKNEVNGQIESQQTLSCDYVQCNQ